MLPLLILNVLLLQLDVLQLPLQLLQRGIIVASFRGDALKVLDARDCRVRRLLGKEVVGRVFHQYVTHCVGCESRRFPGARGPNIKFQRRTLVEVEGNGAAFVDDGKLMFRAWVGVTTLDGQLGGRRQWLRMQPFSPA